MNCEVGGGKTDAVGVTLDFHWICLRFVPTFQLHLMDQTLAHWMHHISDLSTEPSTTGDPRSQEKYKLS